MSVTKLNAQSFDQEVLHSDKPVLVDFYADWCGPCKMLSPVVDEIAGKATPTACARSTWTTPRRSLRATA